LEKSLSKALSAITARIYPLEQQQVAVADSLTRINAVPLLAVRPKPLYDQSTRDGFALSAHPFTRDGGRAVFQIVGEVAAGSREKINLQDGEAVRIMTGAMIPSGCVRVVPFEVCSEADSTVEMSETVLTGRQLYIRFLGSEVKEGKVLVRAGTRLLADHLLMLAENSCLELPVYRTPDVAVICTGSELVDPGDTVHPRQKISGNSVLLSALLRAQGVNCSCSVTVADQTELIEEQIVRVLARKPDMVITTGGMGPGKFDLMEQVFAAVGGTVVYNRLLVRPGKFTLMGMIGQTPFFALPGPPPAVRILFYELIVHALNRLQNSAAGGDNLVTAALAHSLAVKQTGHLNLKGAVARIVDGNVLVHPAGRMEPINAIIHLEGNRLSAEYGEDVKIRLVGPLQGLAD
jgi:molybdopterin molybdotransferase